MQLPRCFDGIGRFPGPPYQIQLDPSITPKQTPCHLIYVHLKEAFRQEINKMLKAGVLKPVHEPNPWNNSFVLVEGKGKVGNLKLRICLDPTNLNKAVIREPYHFKKPREHCSFACKSMHNDCDCKKRILAPRA